MAERKPVYTDFKDPFHLLNELRNVGLERVYKNAFAYGNRDDMNMGYSGQPSSQVGRMSMAQDRLNVNAPTRQFDRSVGSGSYKPSVPTYNVSLNYSQPKDGETPELDRVGTVARPLLALGAEYYRNIQTIRNTQRANAANAPVFQKIEEAESLQNKVQARTRANEARNDFLQRRAAAKQASNAEAMARVQETLSPQASAVLRPRGPKTAWDMLAQPAPPQVTATMGSIYQPPGTLPPPSAPMGGAPMGGGPMGGGPQGPNPSQKGTNTTTLLAANQNKPRSRRKKLPPPPPPQPPTMPPPVPSQLPPPPMATEGTKSTGTKGTKGAGTKGPKGPKGTSGTTKKAKPPTSP